MRNELLGKFMPVVAAKQQVNPETDFKIMVFQAGINVVVGVGAIMKNGVESVFPDIQKVVEIHPTDGERGNREHVEAAIVLAKKDLENIRKAFHLSGAIVTSLKEEKANNQAGYFDEVEVFTSGDIDNRFAELQEQLNAAESPNGNQEPAPPGEAVVAD